MIHDDDDDYDDNNDEPFVFSSLSFLFSGIAASSNEWNERKGEKIHFRSWFEKNDDDNDG